MKALLIQEEENAKVVTTGCNGSQPYNLFGIYWE